MRHHCQRKNPSPKRRTNHYNRSETMNKRENPVNRIRRIVTRTDTKRINGEYQVCAYDQGNNRFPEADYFTTDRSDARATAMAMVNKAKGERYGLGF